MRAFMFAFADLLTTAAVQQQRRTGRRQDYRQQDHDMRCTAVLTRRVSSNLLFRNIVTGVSELGLMVMINGEDRSVSWETVESVAAGVTMIGESEMFVFSLSVDDNDASRVFLISEFEAVWSDLTAMLPVALPASEPFEQWGAMLAAEPGIVTFNERPVQATVL